MRSTKRATAAVAYQAIQMRLELNRSKPRVWREVVVPSSATLWDLHCLITDLFGWGDCHLHEFEVPIPVQRDGQRILGKVPFGIEDRESRGERLAGWLVTFDDLIGLNSPAIVAPPIPDYMNELTEMFGEEPDLPTCRPFWYKYDFGDDWAVKIQVTTLEPRSTITGIRVLGGEWNGPPDDFGGIEAFNAFVAGKGDKADRAERKHWLKEVAPGWTHDGWRPETVNLSDPQLRLQSLLADIEDDGGDSPDFAASFAERLPQFVTEFRDSVKPIIDTSSDDFKLWYGTIIRGTAYLIGRAELDKTGALRPSAWRRPPGDSPLEALARILEVHVPYRENPYEKVAFHAIALAPRHKLHHESEYLVLSYLVVFPGQPETEKFLDRATHQWLPIGKVTSGAAAPAMRIAISAALDLNPSAVEQAANMFVLASFDERCRSILGLDDGQIVIRH